MLYFKIIKILKHCDVKNRSETISSVKWTQLHKILFNPVFHKASDTLREQLTFIVLHSLNLFIPQYSWYTNLTLCVCLCGCVYESACASERVCLFVLSFPISHISCLWFRRQQGPSHESWSMTQTYADLWLTAVTQRGRGRGEEVEREWRGGCHRWDAVSPLTQGSRDEQLAMKCGGIAQHTLCTHMHTQMQLKIAKQRPSTTSANYLAESRPGSRIRVVPAVGLDWRMALIEVKRERRERKAWWEKLSIRDKRLLQQATWLPLRQPYRSVCHKHIDLFYLYLPQKHDQGSSLPTLAGITISLTVSQFAHLPSISFPLALSLVSSAVRKKKTNSFPYKWRESLQPRDPVELQIFHLSLGALCYYSMAIIPSLSFCIVSYFLLCSHIYSPSLSTQAYTDPSLLHNLVFQITHLIEKHPQFLQNYSHSLLPLCKDER